MRVAGIDPSLNNFGLCKGVLTDTFDLHELKLIQTKPDNNNKKSVRKNSDDLRRAKEIYEGFSQFLSDVDLAFVEVPVGSQSARSMTSYGICVGLLASVQIPLIQVTPNEVKLASVGSKTASKAQMIKWAISLYSDANWLTQRRGGRDVVTSKNEHLADAVAAVYAGMNTDTYKQLLAFNKRIA
jgi:Holliday junction resolvasome RuvABC endonuclease subunit